LGIDTLKLPGLSETPNIISLDLQLKGIYISITGPAEGIGFELAKTFAHLDDRVTSHSNSNKGELESVSGVVPLQANVRNEDGVAELFATANQQDDRPLSVLVVNHGI
jgi:NAD(P)-dependent dehydrogenase (short-subunit alcohol dehydrogenase family)